MKNLVERKESMTAIGILSQSLQFSRYYVKKRRSRRFFTYSESILYQLWVMPFSQPKAKKWF